MFQRLKGAIDSRIAEEQARQRNAQPSPSRSNSGSKRPPSRSRAASPAVRAPRSRQTELKPSDLAQRRPDPKEFEPDFVIEDDEIPSRAATPRPVQVKDGEAESASTVEGKTSTENDDQQVEGEKASAPVISDTLPELPRDVQVKLRKLEKLESRYKELLDSYRIAHARVTAIEPFENTLRENTPLTSINDPSALVEYLNQLNLKGDMVLDELKRITAERATFKQKLEEAEISTKKAWDEVAKLRIEKPSAEVMVHDKEGVESASTSTPAPLNTPTQNGDARSEVLLKSPTSSITSRTPSIPGFSLFSPRSQVAEASKPSAESEDLFSYDSEVPRLESELRGRQDDVNNLRTEITSLKNDLSVARESAQGMVQSLEEYTREVNTLRELKERSEAAVVEQRSASETKINDLQSELEQLDGKLRTLEQQSLNDQTLLAEKERLIEDAKAELIIMQGAHAEKAAVVANAAQLHPELEKLEADILSVYSEREQGLKRIDTLNGLVENLRGQLLKAEQDQQSLNAQIDQSQKMVDSLQAQLAKENDISKVATSEVTPVVEATSNKKNKKKKKKGGKAVTEQATDAPADATEATKNLTPTPTVVDKMSDEVGESEMQEVLDSLRSAISEKDAAIDRLHAKLKNGEDMQEEIDSLRDNLVEVGHEHVEAKDSIKELNAEKVLLVTKVTSLQEELSSLRESNELKAASERNLKELETQFNDQKLKATYLQTDLSVAQQLASSRFKDLTDLRAVIQKAQPELMALRTENGDLKVLKEELTTRISELQRIEVRYNVLRGDLTELKKASEGKDTEIKELARRLNEESFVRRKAEEASGKAVQDMQRIEDERRLITQSSDKASKDLAKSQGETSNLREQVRELEEIRAKLEGEIGGLKDDIELKTAQHASAESLMTSMRDQTNEMAVQTRETRERCESLEEELADAHRLLNERSREGETMRRLLAEVEGRADSRIREMKERMDTAIEERDRAEDEASTIGRRRVRELEELRNKLRDIERNLKRAEEDREELEVAQRDWKRRREELEQHSEQSVREAEDVRRAMSELRDALDESERQAKELEKQKTELRRSLEDSQIRLDKLQKSNKAISDDSRSMHSSRSTAVDSQSLQSKRSTTLVDSQTPSKRSSIDSIRTQIGSPGPSSRASSLLSSDSLNGYPPTAIDYVYLKNVLLQFLEQKETKYKMQLIPVLGRLLHFDRKDEQKWMAAVTTK